jgi:hypothetical protein
MKNHPESNFPPGNPEHLSGRLPSNPEIHPLDASTRSTIIISTPNRPIQHPDAGNFDKEFRQEIAHIIHDVLLKAYGSQSGHVQREASRRRTSVEKLLAAYLTRIIMDKVDREYI